MILDKVYMPNDLKKLSISEMETLADEMRELIIKKVNAIGGHMGPNLGIVEATIALHYVFNFLSDKIIFDVSHQCYPHKILTGRKDGYTNPENYLKYSGYTAPNESEFDIFQVGHTSTSISLATGVAKARDLKGKKHNVVALIGDGSLSGGEAYEGLNNAATLESNIIIVVNDNDMSIAENQGGIYNNLRQLKNSDGKSNNNLFKALGFDYYYIKEGNNINKLIEIFEEVKDKNHPIVVHINTQKGKGLKVAEINQEAFHWILPGTLDVNNDENFTITEDYTSVTLDFIEKKIKEDKTVIAINAGTPGIFGFDKNFRRKISQQYTDVGIAEEHAIAYASGLAKCGARPIFTVMSSFVQRTYDQLSQDLCLNNSPITMLVYWGGISSADATHLCVFDIPLISNIPNIVYLAPTTKEEHLAMLEFATKQIMQPIAIRIPTCELISKNTKENFNQNDIGKFKITEEGEKVAIIGLGSFYWLGKQVKDELKAKLGINATLINPRTITSIDETLLENIKENHELVITLEDGVIDGGFGEKITRYYGNSSMKVLNFGAKKEFTDNVPLEELYERYHLTKELIVEDIRNYL